MREIMSYYVATNGQNDYTLFLADRAKTRKQWWTTDLSLAMAFQKKTAAEYSAKRLKYRQPIIMSSQEAIKAERDNERISVERDMVDIHPFSSEGLGQ